MKLKENILIVDDDLSILELLHRHLHNWSYHVYKAISVKEAVSILKDTSIDLLITDLKMPQINGFELINFVNEHYPQMPTLIVTGYPSVQDSLKAIKNGVVDYLTKPFTKNELKLAIDKSLQTKVQPTSPKSSKNATIPKEIVGQSQVIQNIFEIIERVKNNQATVFIEGESGTGKELLARAIHYQGKFAKQPFIAVNCGAIPENLLEAELFGYTKGAFTGAESSRNGFFQAANGGTIFLDEIGNAPLTVQNRLLRVLQEKEVLKIGAQKPDKISLRIIAATNSNLKEMCAKGLFREDLYYRLVVVEIKVPPLRQRKDDIPLLVEKFLLKYGLEYKDKFIKISPQALKVLQRYDWPGNIRELENIIQRAVILSDRSIEVEHLPEHLKYQIDFPEEKLLSLKEVEINYIKKVLQATQNNKTKAAEILGIDRKTIRLKLQE